MVIEYNDLLTNPPIAYNFWDLPTRSENFILDNGQIKFHY